MFLVSLVIFCVLLFHHVHFQPAEESCLVTAGETQCCVMLLHRKKINKYIKNDYISGAFLRGGSNRKGFISILDLWCGLKR